MLDFDSIEFEGPETDCDRCEERFPEALAFPVDEFVCCPVCAASLIGIAAESVAS